jgi:hypothetical protein
VRPLRLVELQSTSDRVQDAVGDTAQVASFKARVVLDADAGEHRDLGSAESGHPAGAAVGEDAGSRGLFPKSMRRERMEENFNLFNFELSAEEVASIDSVWPQR